MRDDIRTFGQDLTDFDDRPESLEEASQPNGHGLFADLASARLPVRIDTWDANKRLEQFDDGARLIHAKR